MSEYLLTIKISFQSMDSLSAREIAWRLLEEYNLPLGMASTKLQQVYTDKQPTGIEL